MIEVSPFTLFVFMTIGYFIGFLVACAIIATVSR